MILTVEDYHRRQAGTHNFHTVEWRTVNCWGTLLLHIRGDPKHPGIVKKELCKIFVQVGNFSPLHRTPSAIGWNDPSATPTAGNIV
jgi:hypothetical protein